ncbi:MAG TPA: glycosyl hydrolase 53 family protein [Acidisarcina sp.]
MVRWIGIAALLLAAAEGAVAQGPDVEDYIVGADVSFSRQMESQGIVFKDHGVAKPVLRILRDHRYNWVRLRIFNDPVTLPNNLEYTVALALQAKAMGYKLLLDFHYADDWADPGHQPTPRAWKSLGHAELVKAVFAYTRDTIAAFRTAGVMPETVQIGNEVTSGMMWPDGKLPDHWERFAGLVSAGIQGVDAGRGTAARPKIMIHIDQGGNRETTQWFFDTLNSYHVAYDIIGQSYYPWWQGSLEELGKNLQFMVRTYHKDVVVVETAYDWRTGEEFKGKKMPFPETPEGQRDFLAALNKVVKATSDGRGLGVFWWEPAAPGDIARRGMFDDEHNALPVVWAFDRDAESRVK